MDSKKNNEKITTYYPHFLFTCSKSMDLLTQEQIIKKLYSNRMNEETTIDLTLCQIIQNLIPKSGIKTDPDIPKSKNTSQNELHKMFLFQSNHSHKNILLKKRNWVNWVENEPQEIKLKISNSYDFQIFIENIIVITKGVEVRTHNFTPIILDPNTLSKKIKIKVIPTKEGDLKIEGCIIWMFHQQFWNKIKVSTRIHVIKQLPLIKIEQLNLEKNHKFYGGEVTNFSIEIENIGNLPIHNISISSEISNWEEFHSTLKNLLPHKFSSSISWNQNQIQEKLPLNPSSKFVLNIQAYLEESIISSRLLFNYSSFDEEYSNQVLKREAILQTEFQMEYALTLELVKILPFHYQYNNKNENNHNNHEQKTNFYEKSNEKFMIILLLHNLSNEDFHIKFPKIFNSPHFYQMIKNGENFRQNHFNREIFINSDLDIEQNNSTDPQLIQSKSNMYFLVNFLLEDEMKFSDKFSQEELDNHYISKFHKRPKLHKQIWFRKIFELQYQIIKLCQIEWNSVNSLRNGKIFLANSLNNQVQIMIPFVKIFWKFPKNYQLFEFFPFEIEIMNNSNCFLLLNLEVVLLFENVKNNFIWTGSLKVNNIQLEEDLPKFKHKIFFCFLQKGRYNFQINLQSVSKSLKFRSISFSIEI
ncbi:hypothetical protein M0811_14038 [Anaeramoeba ignava]|uniref:Trs120/TRAPPC9 first Ig-like domain-containing protein n=1 Tax=Anaeramoeba ignava TaxID=1746090 RepID=A0A9Q0RHR6_ANAIG|nr:hypothetical protein M0811_14038 [Anaeramoeba ignava]